MNEKDFTACVRQLVADYTNEHLDVTDKKRILPDAVFIVWQCKTLQNHKAILAAPTPDQYLFEATYNGDKEQMYLDVYDKIGNVCINGVNMEV